MVSEPEKKILQVLDEMRREIHDSAQSLESTGESLERASNKLEQIHDMLQAMWESRDKAREDGGVTVTTEQVNQQSTTTGSMAKTAFGIILIVAISIALGYAIRASGKAALAQESQRRSRPLSRQESIRQRYSKLIEEPPASTVITAVERHAEHSVSSQLMDFLDELNEANQHLPAEELRTLLQAEGENKRLQLEAKFRPRRVGELQSLYEERRKNGYGNPKP